MPRQATAADLPALQTIVAAAYSMYLPRMDRKPAPMTHDLSPDVAAGRVWVVGDPCEGLISIADEPGALLIENVAVAPAAQGHGTGRMLMAFAEDRAAELGVSRLRLYTNEAMTENLALYAHLGYVEVDRREDDGFSRVFMEKSLVTAPDTESGTKPQTGR